MKETLRDKGRPGLCPFSPSMLQLLHSFYSTCVAHCELNLLNHIESKLSPCSLYLHIPTTSSNLPSPNFYLQLSRSITSRHSSLSIAFHLNFGLPMASSPRWQESCRRLRQTLLQPLRAMTTDGGLFPATCSTCRCASIAVQVAEKETGGLAVSGIFGCQAVLDFFRYEAYIYICVSDNHRSKGRNVCCWIKAPFWQEDQDSDELSDRVSLLWIAKWFANQRKI